MNTSETQRELLSHLDEITRRLSGISPDVSAFSTTSIAEALSISRNLASQYLNDLVRSGTAIKAGSRPVYYFHRRDIERYLQTRIDILSWPTVEQLLSHKTASRGLGFERAIGHDLSLKPCIERLRAAMSYPPAGLPVLLAGAPGTGKATLAELLFESGVSDGLIKQGAKLVVADCSQWHPNTNELNRMVQDSDSWLAQSRGGVLHLKNADLLPTPALDALLQWTAESTNMQADANGPRVRLVLSTSAEKESDAYRALTRRIPVVAYVPSLHERSQEELEELTLHFLKEEGRRMGADIFISRGAFRGLSSGIFDENVRGLRQCVTNCCANAYLNHLGDRVEIRTYQLPPELLTSSTYKREESDSQLIDTARGIDAQPSSRIVAILDEVLAAYQDESTSRDVGQLLERIRDLEDYLAFDSSLAQPRLFAYAHIADEAISSVNGLYATDLSRKSSRLIAQGICLQVSPPTELSRWKERYARRIAKAVDLISRHDRFSAAVTTQLAEEIDVALGIAPDELTRLLVLAHVTLTQGQERERHGMGIILAHGYSTATSLADAANRVLSTRVFESIDMPYDQSIKDVIGPLQQIVDRFSYTDNLIILVDTGSLEDIYKGLAVAPGVTLGAVNNVSTALAIEVGIGLSSGRAVEEVLSEATKACRCSYHVAARQYRKDAIVFCAASGMEASSKIRALVTQSLDREIPLCFVSAEWRQLVNNGTDDALFSTYHIRAIIGTDDPKVGNIPFIAIDDLIAGSGTTKIDRAFAGALDESELDRLHRNLVKNMTLRNVVESITILNPNKLFGEIESAVARLQQLTGSDIGGKLTVGLYVHLCCLVERLVTKTPIESYADEGRFAANHAEFINAFRVAFSDISSHYHVDVPVAEIAYAYDYINSRHAPRKHATQSHSGPEEQQDE